VASVITLFFLVSLTQALPYEINFTLAANPARHIYTDVVASPTINVNQIYCTGSMLTNPINIPPPSWYSAVYSAKLTNSIAGYANQQTCPIASQTSNLNVPVGWLSPTGYSQLASYQDINYISNQLSQNIISLGPVPSDILIEQKSQLMNVSSLPITVGGNQYFRADVGVFCKGSTWLASSNPAYTTAPVNYLGANPSFNLNLNVPGNHILVSNLNVTGCIAAVQIPLVGPCASNTNFGYLYRNISAFPHTFSSSPVTITVQNPFVCQLSSNGGTYTPSPASPSGTVNFSFSLANGGNLPLVIQQSGISLAAGSQFSSLSINPPFPKTIPAGNSITISGTAVAPAAQGSYQLNLSIASQTQTPNCTGQIAQCNAASLFVVNVNVVPPHPDACVIFAQQGQTNNILPGSSRLLAANCTSGGNPINCPALNWAQNAQGGSLSQVQTPAGASPNSTLSIASTAPFPQPGKSVTVSHTGANPFSCNWPFSVATPPHPDSCTLTRANDGQNNNLVPGEQYPLIAQCRYQGAPYNCPNLTWTQNANGASMSPSHTTPAEAPQSTLIIDSSAYYPQHGRMVTATSQNSPFPQFFCTAPFSIVSPNFHIQCGFTNHSSEFFPGEGAQAQASCLQGGNAIDCPALNWTTTIVQGSLTPPQTPAGPSPRTSRFGTDATAPAPQIGVINITCADPAQCTNFCTINVTLHPYPDRLVCSLINHSNTFASNDSALVLGNCTKNNLITACPPLHWFTTIEGGGLNPAYTPAILFPVTNFTTHNAPVNQTGNINAQSDLPGFATLRCDAAIPITVSELGPDYIVTGVTPSKLIAQPGEVVQIAVKVKNRGNQNATNQTHTLLSGNCTAQTRPLAPLNALAEVEDRSFTCTCAQGGITFVVVEANHIREEQYEYDYQNNQGVGYFYCGEPFAPLCPDYV